MNRFDLSAASRGRGEAQESNLRQWLSRVVDAGLIGVPMLCPWFMGGRHPLGELVVVLLSVTVTLAWLGRRALDNRADSWTRSPAEWILLGAIMLVVAQIIPWPQSVFDTLSPHSHGLLPLWSGDASVPGTMGTWNQVSMTPEWTRAGLTLLLAYSMLFVVAVQRLRSVEDVSWMLRWIGGAVVLQAVFGIVQFVTTNGKFVWVYEHPFRKPDIAVMGAFINKNHFAHLMALGLAPLVCLVAARLKRNRQSGTASFSSRRKSSEQIESLFWTMGLGVVLLAGLLTFSRGGALALAVTALVVVGALFRAGMLSWRFVLASLGVAGLIGVSLLINGYQKVVERLDDYTAGSIEELDQGGGRRAIWEADFKALPDYSLLGSGVGSHREVYPMYLTDSWEVEFTHAENGYLQIALETGMPGLALLLLGIVMCGLWCFRGLSARTDRKLFLCAAAVAAPLAASAAHSMVDFVWYIPSLMAITTLLAACAYRLALASQPAESAGKAGVTWSAWQWRLAPIAIAVLGAWMTYDRFCAAMAEPHWDQFLRFALKASTPEGEGTSADGSIAEALEQVLYWTPDNGKAHVRLASLLLGRFEQLQQEAANSMPLNQISEAAMASRDRFGSVDALNDWLDRAVGENRHLLNAALWHLDRGLSTCALMGEGYIHLADLCFLKGQGQADRLAYLDQALKVRPYDGVVLLAAGSAAALRGDVEAMIGYWRPVLRCREQERMAMVRLLTSMPISIDEVLTAFQPDLTAVRLMFKRYSQTMAPEQMGPLYVSYTQQLQQEIKGLDPEQAAPLWQEMYLIYHHAGQLEDSVKCLKMALAGRPTEFDWKLSLGRRLNDLGRFDEAREQLEWCVQRRPEAAGVKEHLEVAVKGQIDERTGGTPSQFREVRN